MSENNNGDKRAKERIQIQEKVRIRCDDMTDFITEYSDNISLGGMFIKSNDPFPTGTRFKLELSIGDKNETITAVGEVVWTKEFSADTDVRPSGMGVRFVELKGKSKAFIKGFMEKYADEE